MSNPYKKMVTIVKKFVSPKVLTWKTSWFQNILDVTQMAFIVSLLRNEPDS